MVFSSIVFIFFFLPIVLGLYLFVPRRLKNYYLFIVSVIFYTWSSFEYLPLIFFSIVFNYIIGLLINKYNKEAKIFLTFGVIVDLVILSFFKYFNFLGLNFNKLIIHFERRPINFPDVILPIGISFFTFQVISYIIDVYRKRIKAEKNPFNFAFYISFFPHLIAGPIVRYEEIYEEIKNRVTSNEAFTSGIIRFSEGLAKKAVLANNLAIIADKIFALTPDKMSFGLSWVGVIFYTLQIYFDFSAYSDMAIGLAKMFGFNFPENFNYPYTAMSIKDFWSRWHISLSRWFRDYVYIPLGGNRVSRIKTHRNIFVVFLLTGLWHGAAWTFILWGAYYGLFLVFEKILEDRINRINQILRYLTTMLIVIFGWALFRADSMTYAVKYWYSMVNITDSKGYYSIFELMNAEVISVLIVSVFFALNLHNRLATLVKRNLKIRIHNELKIIVIDGAYKLIKIIVLVSSAAVYLAAGTYNPFIYFRF